MVLNQKDTQKITEQLYIKYCYFTIATKYVNIRFLQFQVSAVPFKPKSNMALSIGFV